MTDKDYNCFRCPTGLKYNSHCGGQGYMPPKGMKICTWYLTAKNDMAKYEQAKLTNTEPVLTLGHMLNKYLGVKK